MRCVRAVVAASDANAHAEHARKAKAVSKAVERTPLPPRPGDFVAIVSTLGEAESVTNHPKEQDEGQKGVKAAVLLGSSAARDAGQR